MKNNIFYKRELESLRSALGETRKKVNSNHFPNNDQDFLLESTKERVRNLQYQRENEVGGRYEDHSSSPPQFQKSIVSSEKITRNKISEEDKGSNKKYFLKPEEEFESEILMDSVGTNKTYDLSQSLKASSYEYKDKISGGLKNLEEKMNQMERELDDHLIYKNKEYFTNKELVKMKQKQREEELLKNHYIDEFDQSEDEDEKTLNPLQQKILSEIKPNNKFKNAFEKREDKLKRDSEQIEKETPRRIEIHQSHNLVKDIREDQDLIEEKEFDRELAFLK